MIKALIVSIGILYNGYSTPSNTLDHTAPKKRTQETIEWKRLYKPLHIIPRLKVKPRYNKRMPKVEPLYYLAPPWDDLKDNLA